MVLVLSAPLLLVVYFEEIDYALDELVCEFYFIVRPNLNLASLLEFSSEFVVYLIPDALA